MTPAMTFLRSNHHVTSAMISTQHGCNEMATLSAAPFTLFKQGAEARLYLGDFYGRPCLIKERFAKSYRHPDLDRRLTTDRLRAEVRILSRCRQLGISAPAVYFVDKFASAIYMEYLQSALTVRQVIDVLLDESRCDYSGFIVNFGLGCQIDTKQLCEALATEIGKILAVLHKNGIVHGDLTTSNLLVRRDAVIDLLMATASERTTLTADQRWTPELVLIDFGLSFVSEQVEDEAVDLYVLERALLSAHTNARTFMNDIMKAYKDDYPKRAGKVVLKLDEVRARGRKREMIG